ncbi:MAG: hypothetical protein ACRDY0_11060, partial [Acidimicrobiales bacterium]
GQPRAGQPRAGQPRAGQPRAGAEASPASVGLSPRLRRRWEQVVEVTEALNQAEDAAGLPRTRRGDLGFVSRARAWASGRELSRVIATEDLSGGTMSGGDFVRNVKQLVDLLSQLGGLVPDPATAGHARAAAAALFRGVVAASSAPPGGPSPTRAPRPP